jgi:hypothetical protein
MEKHFTRFTFCHIPRSKNEEANELAKAAAQRALKPANVFYQELSVKAIQDEEERPCSVHTIGSKEWRSPIFTYLNGTYEPQSKHETNRMISKTKHTKAESSRAMLKCISREQGTQLLSEMHAIMCGAHRGPHEIAHRVMRQGFYWPTTVKDVKDWSIVVKAARCSLRSRKPQLTQLSQSFQHGHCRDGEST